MRAWLEALNLEVLPTWLSDFARDPDTALDQALWGNYYFGSLNAREPVVLLLDWLEMIGDAETFAGRMDRALESWIQANWGKPAVPEQGKTVSRLAQTWIALFTLLAKYEKFELAPRELQARFGERDFLTNLTVGPAQDPLGAYLTTLAVYQTDDSLVPYWWRLCNLDDGIRWFHGYIGILGLRFSPPTGGFKGDVARGLLRLADGLGHRMDGRSIQAEIAKEEFLRVARITVLAYPFPNKWKPYFFRHMKNARQGSKTSGWIRIVSTELGLPQQSRSAQTKGHNKIFKKTQLWKDRAGPIVEGLGRDQQQYLPQANGLIKELEEDTRQSGDSGFIVKTLCNFAMAVMDSAPAQAEHWTSRAKTWEPWNGRGWTIHTTALLRQQKLVQALANALEAVERFPENVVTRCSLADVFLAGNELDQAEVVLRQTIQLFPQNVVARSSLVKVLCSLGSPSRLQEAKELVESVLAIAPADPVALNEKRRLEGIVGGDLPPTRVNGITHESSETSQDHQLDVNQIVETLRGQNQGDVLTPAQARTLCSLARLLRSTAPPDDDKRFTASLECVLQLLTSVVRDRPGFLEALTEQGLAYKDLGNLQASDDILQKALEYGDGAYLRFSLACLHGKRALQDQWELKTVGEDFVHTPWQEVQNEDMALYPVRLLGEARTWTHVLDGDTVKAKARGLFDQARNWLRPNLQPKSGSVSPSDDSPEEIKNLYKGPEDFGNEAEAKFQIWWSREIQAYTFGSIPPTDQSLSDADLETVVERVNRYASDLDRLGEVYVVRLNRAAQ